MKTFENSRVGLRNKETRNLIAVYPEAVTGNIKEIEKKVFDWFYQTGCSAEEEMRDCFVDALNEHELKGLEG